MWIAHERVLAKDTYCLAKFDGGVVCPRTGRVGQWVCVDESLETVASDNCDCSLKHTRASFGSTGRYAFIPDECPGAPNVDGCEANPMTFDKSFKKEHREFIQNIRANLNLIDADIDCPTGPLL